MDEFYEVLPKIYDDCEISKYSVLFGQSMLKYLEIMYPNDSFKKNIDLCCGTGTLCNFFKENGIETKGVDVSKEMLGVAMEKYPDIEFVHCDILDYEDDEKYDFVTSTDDAFNHFLEIDDLKKAFKSANGLLRKDGLLIFDMCDFDLFELGRFEKFSKGNKKLFYTLSRKDIFIHSLLQYYENDELLIEQGILERNYSADEIIELLNDTGFVLELCAQYFFNETDSRRYKLVARKIKGVSNDNLNRN